MNNHLECVFLFAYVTSETTSSGISRADFDALFSASAFSDIAVTCLTDNSADTVSIALLAIPSDRLDALNAHFASQTSLSISHVDWPDKPALEVFDLLVARLRATNHASGLPMPYTLHETIKCYG
jgi:hypothetical protein